MDFEKMETYLMAHEIATTAVRDLIRRLGLRVDGVDLERGIPFSWRRLNPAIFISEAVYDEWVEEGCGGSCEFAEALMVNFILEAIARPLIEGRGPADEHELVVVLAALDWLERRLG